MACREATRTNRTKKEQMARWLQGPAGTKGCLIFVQAALYWNSRFKLRSPPPVIGKGVNYEMAFGNPRLGGRGLWRPSTNLSGTNERQRQFATWPACGKE